MNESLKIYAILAIILTALVVLCINSCHERQVELEKFKIQQNVK